VSLDGGSSARFFLLIDSGVIEVFDERSAVVCLDEGEHAGGRRNLHLELARLIRVLS